MLNKTASITFILFVTVVFAVTGIGKDRNKVELKRNDSGKCVDVFVDGKFFTSYIYSDTIPVLRKPVLYPVVAASGVTVTRGYPLQPRQGERIDHPHHIGMWFNYGNVNGLDFWNNSDAIPAGKADSMGTIKHTGITAVKTKNGNGELDVTADWINSKGGVLLKEATKYYFHAEDGARYIDRVTTLTAANGNVSLADNKEGVFGMRVARELELPSKEAVILSDAHGNKTEVPVMDNAGVTGNYLNSEGITGNDTWGKRARWTALSGTVSGKDVTIVIFDNPNNVGFPTYWHARDYGLFAANPLGQSIFSNGKETLNYILKAGKSVTFTYRVLILDGKPGKEKIETEYLKFAKKK
jgi:hypothetical protein